MRESEYLEAVTGQMRCKRARSMVERELKQHIEDQAMKYKDFGMGEEEARQRAVEQMGDPVVVGTDMDRIHRPRMDKGVFLFICLLSVGGSFLWQLLAGMDGTLDGAWFFDIGAFGRLLLGSCIPGLFLMWVVMRLDYTRIGRHPFAAALAVIGVAWIYNMQLGYPWNGKYGMHYLFLVLMTVFYGAAVYALRGKGLKGIILCILWLFAQIVLFSMASAQYINQINFVATGLLVMSTAAVKDWFGTGKRKALITIWGGVGVPAACAAFVCLITAKGYVWKRLEAWFGATDPWFGNITSIIRKELAGAGLLSGTGNNLLLGNENEYFLLHLISRHGWLSAILILTLLCALFVFLFRGIKKAHNRMGTLMGTAAVFSLMLPVLEHILYNTGLIPAGALVLPFFSVTGYDTYSQGSYCIGAILAYYVAMGVCLSIYRIRNIVSEEDNRPRIKLKWERT